MKRFRILAVAVLAVMILASSAMAVHVDDSVLDAALGIIDNATHVIACNSEPANYAGIGAAGCIVDVTVTAGAGNGDWVIANDTSGRKISLTEQTAITPSGNGHVDFLCAHDTTTLLGCTTLNTPTGFTLATTETWSIAAQKFYTIPDPQ